MYHAIKNIGSIVTGGVPRFTTAIYQEDAKWWFRWQNITEIGRPLPLAQGRRGPFEDEQAAEVERQEFINEETRKRPSVLFEPE